MTITTKETNLSLIGDDGLENLLAMTTPQLVEFFDAVTDHTFLTQDDRALNEALATAIAIVALREGTQ